MTGASLPTATAPSTTWNSAHRARLSLSVARRHVEIKMARSPEAASSARSRLRLPLASGQPRPISRLGRADQPYRACLRHRQDDHGHVDACGGGRRTKVPARRARPLPRAHLSIHGDVEQRHGRAALPAAGPVRRQARAVRRLIRRKQVKSLQVRSKQVRSKQVRSKQVSEQVRKHAADPVLLRRQARGP